MNKISVFGLRRFAVRTVAVQSFAFLAFLVSFIFPIALFTSGTSAVSSSTTMDFKLNLNSVIAISTNTNEIAVDISPTASGATGQGSGIVTVSTNNQTGTLSLWRMKITIQT